MKGKLADLFYWIGEKFYQLGDWIAPVCHNLTEEQVEDARTWFFGDEEGKELFDLEKKNGVQ